MLTGKLPWVALGTGILILAVGIFLAASLLQREQVIGTLPGADQGTFAELDAASVEPKLAPVAGVAMSDSFDLGAGRGVDANADATVSDSAKLEFQNENAPAPPGGPGVVARFKDGADLVVRDAGGNIKQQETVN